VCPGIEHDTLPDELVLGEPLDRAYDGGLERAAADEVARMLLPRSVAIAVCQAARMALCYEIAGLSSRYRR